MSDRSAQRRASSDAALSELTDREVGHLWLRGDGRVLPELDRRYRQRLESVAYRIVGNHADAEDVVQRVFLALPRAAYSGAASLWTYLYRAATNTAINLLRARRELARVARGATMIRRKREALVAELFRLARPAVDERARIHERATEATRALLDALSVHGASGLAPMSWPLREPEVEIRPALVWGIAVSDVTSRVVLARTLDARGLAGHCRQRDARGQADVADVGHVARAAQRVHLGFEGGGQLAHALRRVFAFQHIQRRQARRTGERMCGIRVAVREFDGVVRTACGHEHVVDG